MKRIIIAAIVTMVALGMARSVRADAAPPPPPSAGSIEGQYPTNVQMVSENVLMTITDDRAYVHGVYNLRNQGKQSESFDVRFPLSTPDMQWMKIYLPINDFTASVDGHSVSVTIKSEDVNPSNPNNNLWAHWHVTFPPGKDVSVEVSYEAFPGFGGNNRSSISYMYILQTGAGWYGEIGEGTVTVHAPYSINDINFYSLGFNKPALSDSDAIWRFKNLEPTDRDNIEFILIPPPLWRDYVKYREQAEGDDASASAHFIYADTIRKIVAQDRGCLYESNRFRQLADNGLLEYQKALELAPNSVNILLGEAHLLAEYCDDRISEFVAAVDNAYAVAPDNPEVSQLKQDVDQHIRPGLIMTMQVEKNMTMQWETMASIELTKTSTTTPTLTTTPSAVPTTPAVAPAPIDSSPSPLAPIIGGVGALGVAAFFAVRWYRRRWG